MPLSRGILLISGKKVLLPRLILLLSATQKTPKAFLSLGGQVLKPWEIPTPITTTPANPKDAIGL